MRITVLKRNFFLYETKVNLETCPLKQVWFPMKLKSCLFLWNITHIYSLHFESPILKSSYLSVKKSYWSIYLEMAHSVLVVTCKLDVTNHLPFLKFIWNGVVYTWQRGDVWLKVHFTWHTKKSLYTYLNNLSNKMNDFRQENKCAAGKNAQIFFVAGSFSNQPLKTLNLT